LTFFSTLIITCLGVLPSTIGCSFTVNKSWVFWRTLSNSWSLLPNSLAWELSCRPHNRFSSPMKQIFFWKWSNVCDYWSVLIIFLYQQIIFFGGQCMYIGVLVYGLYIESIMRNVDWYVNCRIPNSKLAQLSHVK
jgi:hypothetical protein